tara:strand:+ start:732 stop:1424 length:693 start_codon:yes stop_codon:yes gene_type:complete
MEKITITLDGHSGCGKSTLAKSIAQELNYVYVDSGAMYRAITYYFTTENLIENDVLVEGWESSVENVDLTFEKHTDYSNDVIFLNGECAEPLIRTMQVSSLVSLISKERVIREKLVELQRSIGKNSGVVMDGRDIGSVVFPEAEVKFWVTADIKVRAKRRYHEILNNGGEVDFNEVLKNLKNRDFEDSNRSISPLIRPSKSILVDNSDLTIDQTLEFTMNIINSYLENNS